MRVRALLVAALAALVPSGSAHASCLDDATARQLNEGYENNPKSPYYESLGYVQVTGTATVTVRGDALASDAVLVADDWVRWAGVVGANAADITTDFADCVAG